jgi:hypothetical protein
MAKNWKNILCKLHDNVEASGPYPSSRLINTPNAESPKARLTKQSAKASQNKSRANSG